MAEDVECFWSQVAKVGEECPEWVKPYIRIAAEETVGAILERRAKR